MSGEMGSAWLCQQHVAKGDSWCSSPGFQEGVQSALKERCSFLTLCPAPKSLQLWM